MRAILRYSKDGASRLNLIIAVKDKGIGLTKMEIEHIFDPVYRSYDHESQRMNPHSNGIGLSICK